MAKRRAKTAKTSDSLQRLRKSLAKCTKAKLIETLVELAEDDRRILRRLDEQFDLEALSKSDLPADEVAAWCAHMLAGDSVGFVCDEELKSLRQQFEASS